ncbi:MAG: hypothetical protein GY702_24365, partial [Desulfobulbaceae bacterium]|nr:hypothetical protein [Desulfobulbaceae bacterium]
MQKSSSGFTNKAQLLFLTLIVILFCCSNVIAGVWWDDRTNDIDNTLEELRSLFSISYSDATDDELKYLLRYDDYGYYLSNVKAQISFVKFGQQLPDFLTGNCFALDEEEGITSILDDPIYRSAIDTLVTVLSRSPDPTLMVLSGVSQLLLAIHDVTNTYQSASSIFSCPYKRYFFNEYFNLRQNNAFDQEAAWQDIQNTFTEELVAYANQGVQADGIKAYLESAYQAKILAEDDAELEAVGDGIVSEAKRLWIEKPPVVTSRLEFSDFPYKAGEGITASFAITNTGS